MLRFDMSSSVMSAQRAQISALRGEIAFAVKHHEFAQRPLELAIELAKSHRGMLGLAESSGGAHGPAAAVGAAVQSRFAR